MKLAPVAVATVLGLLLAGCSTNVGPGASGTGAPVATSAAATTVPAADLLARHDLGGLGPVELVEKLEASEVDRAEGPMVSVRPTELVITDGTLRAQMPLPSDRFYLSIAPYITSTHDCFNHNLATCRGELRNQAVHVKVVDNAGTQLVDRDMTTYSNGFAGLWLPRKVHATLTVTYAGRSATASIGTAEDDPTCLTTLQLR